MHRLMDDVCRFGWQNQRPGAKAADKKKNQTNTSSATSPSSPKIEGL
jgi:hypothetical protein